MHVGEKKMLSSCLCIKICNDTLLYFEQLFLEVVSFKIC